MHEINLKFEGICTHLMATHRYNGAPRFKLSSDGQTVRHRVFLPNSDKIPGHTPPAREPIPHVPKLLIPGPINQDLEELFTREENMYVWRPTRAAIGFEGVDPDVGDVSHHDSLNNVPRIWMFAGRRGSLRDRVKQEWSNFATAYVDFTTGVSFWTEMSGRNVAVFGTLHFDDTPTLVVREENAGAGRRYRLDGVRDLIIRNEPERGVCTANDYLLHYFATDLDMSKAAPVWPLEDSSGEPGESLVPDEGMSEVYCSSSQYP